MRQGRGAGIITSMFHAVFSFFFSPSNPQHPFFYAFFSLGALPRPASWLLATWEPGLNIMGNIFWVLGGHYGFVCLIFFWVEGGYAMGFTRCFLCWLGGGVWERWVGFSSLMLDESIKGGGLGER